MPELIRRNMALEIRADAEAPDGVISGRAIVYDTPTDIGGWFQETIVKGAIDEEQLKEDISLYWNHDYNSKRLARSVIPLSDKGGLELSVDEKGLPFKANLNLKRTDANDLYESIKDGTCTAMSFGFYVDESRWEDEDTNYPKRFITKLTLVEISCVNDPAYKATTVGLRSNLSSENDKLALDQMLLSRKNKQDVDNAKELELLKIKTLILNK